MEVVSVELKGTSLCIVCEGDFGSGTSSVGKTVGATEYALENADTNQIAHLHLDFSRVEYAWGDGPVQVVYSAMRFGIWSVTIRPSFENREALIELINAFGVSKMVHLAPAVAARRAE